MRLHWMRCGLLLFGLVLGGVTPVRAGDHDGAWARFAGEHMGRVEAGSNCAGYRVNAGRRALVLALYSEPILARILEAERSAKRREQEKTIAGDDEACPAIIAAYGPAGLSIRNYLLPIGTPDVPEQPGLDRGLPLNVDPRGMIALHWLTLSGTATAIETICKGYEMVPLVEAHHYLAGQLIGTENAMLMASAAMMKTGEDYRLKSDRSGFCGRILADYGPKSSSPVVRKKAR